MPVNRVRFTGPRTSSSAARPPHRTQGKRLNGPEATAPLRVGTPAVRLLRRSAGFSPPSPCCVRSVPRPEGRAPGAWFVGRGAWLGEHNGKAMRFTPHELLAARANPSVTTCLPGRQGKVKLFRGEVDQATHAEPKQPQGPAHQPVPGQEPATESVDLRRSGERFID